LGTSIRLLYMFGLGPRPLLPVSALLGTRIRSRIECPSGSALGGSERGMGISEAIQFVETHGLVLESARGGVPSLAEWIAGEPILGSWWGHPKSDDIWAVTRALRRSSEILVCRLIDGKITYVHRRLWPALVRLAACLPPDSLSKVEEVHTPTGKHVVNETLLTEWASEEVFKEAEHLSKEEALEALGHLRSVLQLGLAANADGPAVD